jgi:hypothetical protein
MMADKERKARRAARILAFLFVGGLLMGTLGFPILLVENIPNHVLIGSVMGFGGIFMIASSIIYGRRDTKVLNPSLSEVSGPAGPPPDSLTELLTKGSQFPSGNTEYQVVSVLKGITAEVSRSGFSYKMKVKLEPESEVKEVKGGIGVVRISKYQRRFYQGVNAFVTINEWYPLQFRTSNQAGQTVVEFESGGAFPCSGFINDDSMGIIFAPVVSFGFGRFYHAMVLMLEPAPASFSFTPAKETLVAAKGTLQCSAQVQGGRGIVGELQATGAPENTAILSIHRYPVRFKEKESRFGYSNFYKETIAELLGESSRRVSWTPTVPKFNPTAWVSGGAIGDVYMCMRSIGGGTKESRSSKLLQPFFFGDSKALQYLLRITSNLDGKDQAKDETQLNLD